MTSILLVFVLGLVGCDHQPEPPPVVNRKPIPKPEQKAEAKPLFKLTLLKGRSLESVNLMLLDCTDFARYPSVKRVANSDTLWWVDFKS